MFWSDILNFDPPPPLLYRDDENDAAQKPSEIHVSNSEILRNPKKY